MLALSTIDYQEMTDNNAINTQNDKEERKIGDKENIEIPLKVIIHAQKMEKAIIFFNTCNTS